MPSKNNQTHPKKHLVYALHWKLRNPKVEESNKKKAKASLPQLVKFMQLPPYKYPTTMFLLTPALSFIQFVILRTFTPNLIFIRVQKLIIHLPMAQTNSRSSTTKALHYLSLFSLLLLVQKGSAYQFKVGGSGSWSLPSDPNSNSYNQWAERSRFQIGDTLLFVYSGDEDSVLLVNKDDYNNCNTDNALKKFTDGNTVFKFEHSGPYYFISGVKDNCLKNEKLTVVVMADRSNHAPPPSNETAAAPPPSNETTTSPAPSPSNETTTSPPPSPSNETTTSPPPSPYAEVPPSPAPSGEEAPSPPASVEINPTPAPSEQLTPKKNGASSIVKSFIAPVGAFIGSCLLTVF